MTRLVKSKLRWAAVSAVAGMVAFAGQSQAATRTWDGGGADDNVNIAGNWVNDTLPVLNAGSGGPADDWIFTGSTRTSPIINVFPSDLAASFTFDANAAVFTINAPPTSSTNFATLGTTANGHVTNNSANVQTLSGNFANRGGIINANTASVVINGVWQIGNLGLSSVTGPNAPDTRTNNFSGQASIFLHTQLTSSGRLLKQGPNTLYIDNNLNDYIGTTRIEAGAIQISAPNALGRGVSGTTGATFILGNANGTGRLELSSGTNTGVVFNSTENLTIEGRQGAASTAPHLLNVSGNNTWAAPINFNTGGSEYTVASSGGSLNISGNITSGLGGSRNLYFNGAANGEVSGQINNTNATGLFTVTKNGAGTWTLSGSNSYNGALTVNAGTLVLANVNNTAAPVAVNGGTLKLLSTGSLTSTPSITLGSPTSALDVTDYTANGGYTLQSSTALNGGGHVKGQFNVGGGASISAGSTLTPTTFAFENGLSFNGGGIYSAFISGTNHSLLDVTGGTLSATGLNDVRVAGAGAAVGQYPLLHYAGALAGDGVTAFNLAQLPPRATANLVNNTAGHSIDLNITAIDMPKWTGAVSGQWDVNSTANWKEVNSGQPTTYLEPNQPGDAVLFDDAATGYTTVSLDTTVNPSAVTANNTSLAYTIAGSGSINGATSIVKNGAGTFAIANTGGNNYTGGTFVNAGTLQVGDATGNGGSLGTGTITLNSTLAFNRNDDVTLANVIVGNGALRKQGTGILTLAGNNANYNGVITIAQGTLRGSGSTNFGSTNTAIVVLDGGTLDTNFAQMGSKTITAIGAGVGGNGAIVNNGGGQLNTLENVVLAGDTTFGGIGRWDIRNLGNLTQLSTAGHAYNLTKVGANQVSIVDATVDPALADVNVNGGILGIETKTTGLGNPNNTLTVSGGGTFQLWNYTALDKKIVGNGGTLQAASGGNNALVGTIAFNADTTVLVNSGVALTLSNVISGVGGLIKTQTGTLNLTNPANTYTGANNLTGTVVVAALANGGQASSIGRSTADASNLTLNATTLRYTGAAASSTDHTFTITGNPIFEAAGVTLDATVAFTNPAPVTFNNPTTNAATLTLTGANAGLNVFAPSLTDAVASGTGVAGPLSLTKSAFGTWVLPTANTFTGNVTVTGGILRVRNGSALGVNNLVAINDNTANPNPASVIFDDPTGVTVANNFRTTGGGGGGANADGPGVIRAAAGNNVLTGNILMTSGGGFSTYTADAGATLNFAGTITNDTARTLDAGGNGTVVISGSLNDGTGVTSLEKRGAGTTLVSGSANGYTGSTLVNSGVLRVTGSIANSSSVTTANTGTFEAASTQTVRKMLLLGGQAKVTGGPTVVTASVLTVGDNTGASTDAIAIAPGARVDLTTNALVLDVVPGSEAAAAADIRAKIILGRAGGTWQGNGITSSAAALNPSSSGIGYALATEILGPNGGDFMTKAGVDDSSVLVRYTLLGDADLDGKVGFPDLVAVAQHYDDNSGNATWFTGDFDYDGNVGFADLVSVAQNYDGALPGAGGIPGAPADFNQQLAAAFAAAAVPEPGAISLFAVAACGLAARRRRR